MRPNSNLILEDWEYPIAAGTPESGTGTIISASTPVSLANSSPNLLRYS